MCASSFNIIEMSAWKFGVASYLLLAHVGCIDPVLLGRECATVSDCLEQEKPDGPPVGPMDAATFDAAKGIVDAGVDDAAADAGDAQPAAAIDAGDAPLYPALENGSFELTKGNYGGLALAAFEPIPIGSNVAEPWAACSTGYSVLQSADATRNSGARDVLPRDGDGFIQADFGFTGVGGLRQSLITPLRSGQRYAFRIDARAAVGSGVTLELWGSNLSCVGASKLADLGTLPESWSSQCVSFVAPSDFSQLMLLPAMRGASTMPPARLFFDALRRDDSCP
jgi:hypothetical protein